MYYIAAPFGNYLKFEKTTSVAGTFTVSRRPGLIKQLIKTLRYSPFDKCWYNQLGLRNPGIKYAVNRYKSGQIISIAAIEQNDWLLLNNIIPKDIPLELNISCPNINHFEDYIKDIHLFRDRDCIVKLPPKPPERMIYDLVNIGFRKFHCCNTLMTEKGARSGKILIPLVTRMIINLKNIDNEIYCIAGGGIDSIEDIDFYRRCGADGFSFGTVCFNPFKLRKIINYVSQ